MREIKFRAWDSSAARMFYGVTNVKVLNLMLCVGLKDKNGVDIYGGDIVEFEYDTRYDSGGYHRGVHKAAVQNGLDFERIKTGHYIRFNDIKSRSITKPLDWSEVGNLEVIGNIYENPELLTDK